ncbi:helix-turn-helix domain-containing protein [Rhizobium leguminosarum]|uniref:Crp/Fnr family transcriptional regulator n=1 Tax=Rhizobium leguminosarum TaxID=384 RepID=UPI0014419150|nr:helix-turn-helix domain-containing protein [Rhizobium leguminosarum]MBY5838538.1 helix-turn-helix domain-containing protein [Rhizobium leguminosarum]MBY5867768.1 helix-turn-helix domain-containing protein [Rhizobium leguminosarum]NKM04738.1 helix-turn-helix domain-containing protein [Rhizobium leguminosarum bv. viciae]NKM76670.1 helix-turn-helix domain-containing protein [Rhizobium leguminosarum bv. viciae]QSZ07559.1 helix-turn-helix domain-containing protein [Rhizobium leguminosarum]
MLMQSKNAFENAELAVEATRGPCLSSVFRASSTELVETGQAICWEGDDAKHLFQIVEGVVRLHRIIGEGRRVITAFHFAGDVVGASLLGEFLFTAEAVTDCKIRRISRKNFHQEVARCDELRPAYIDLLCRENAAAHDQMVLLSKKNAEERLCTFILRLASRPGARRRDVLRVPMNRQDIADYLGLTIETVSRTITKLAARDVLVAQGRHDLKILSMEKLARLSGGADDFSAKTCHRVSIH